MWRLCVRTAGISKWVPSEAMIADCLTKRSSQLRDAFRRWMSNPEVSLQQSKDASAGSTNDQWRQKQGQQSTEDLTSVKLAVGLTP